MAEQPDPAADRPGVRDQVLAEDDRLPADDPQQAGAGPQEAGLAGPVGPWSSTISPAATSRSTPARTGKRPTRATAERKRIAGSMTAAPTVARRALRMPSGRERWHPDRQI